MTIKKRKSKIAIKCNKVCKSFGKGDLKVEVLKKVDLEVKQGEFMMLVGPSGCGKTTLISILAGILPFDSGQCSAFGQELNDLSEKEMMAFRSKNVGFVFQNYNLIPTLTVAENVAIPLIIGGMDRKLATAKSETILQAVGLGDKCDHSPTLLSGGQQQRVAIARSLVHSPRLLICDEPTSALDLVTGTKIVELLRHINRELGTTFIVVTHDNRIIKFADRVVHLDDGVIKKESTGEDHE